jgi:hypothetical protein
MDTESAPKESQGVMDISDTIGQSNRLYRKRRDCTPSLRCAHPFFELFKLHELPYFILLL